MSWACGNCNHPIENHDWTFRTCHAEAFHEKRATYPMTRACDKGCQMFVPQYDTKDQA